MTAKYYTLSEIKQLALDNANVIGLTTQYLFNDSTNAYNYAVGLCGFENPDSSDVNYIYKQSILLDAMQLYFLKDVQKKYLLKFDVGDLKLGQVSRVVMEMIKDVSDSLAKAKDNPATAALFLNASSYFGTVVYKPGIADDAIGQSVNPDEVE